MTRNLRVAIVLALFAQACSRKPSADTLRHVDAANGFSIEFPKDWTLAKPAAGDVMVFSAVRPKSMDTLIVQTGKVPPGTTAEQWVEGFFTPPFTLLESKPDTVDGMPAVRTISSVRIESKPIRQIGFVLVLDGRYFKITASTEEAAFGLALPFLERGCRSFKLEGKR